MLKHAYFVVVAVCLPASWQRCLIQLCHNQGLDLQSHTEGLPLGLTCHKHVACGKEICWAEHHLFYRHQIIWSKSCFMIYPVILVVCAAGSSWQKTVFQEGCIAGECHP